MKIDILASGSKGNCYQITNSKGATLLIECGIPLKDISRKLNFKLPDACVITHSHNDHSRAVHDLIKRSVDCYMSKGTAEELQVYGHRVHTFELDEYDQEKRRYRMTSIGDFIVRPFRLVHDTKEPVGFVISDVNMMDADVVFITDTAYIEPYICFNGILMVECNYVKSILDQKVKDEEYSVKLRNRVLNSHLSLETLDKWLEEQMKFSKITKVYLLHLSDSNSDEELIKRTIQNRTGVPVYVS